jgi:hypothetical protein
MVDAVRTYDAKVLERVVFAVFGPEAERAFRSAVEQVG